VNAAAEDRRFSLYRFVPGWSRQIPTDRFGGQFATSDEPERQVTLPGGGLARRR